MLSGEADAHVAVRCGVEAGSCPHLRQRHTCHLCGPLKPGFQEYIYGLSGYGLEDSRLEDEAQGIGIGGYSPLA